MGALYNAKTTKEAFSNPDDILCLSRYNSVENVYDLSESDNDGLNEILPGVKRVSLDSIDDVKFDFDF